MALSLSPAKVDSNSVFMMLPPSLFWLVGCASAQHKWDTLATASGIAETSELAYTPIIGSLLTGS
jgi:hypothetical protein